MGKFFDYIKGISNIKKIICLVIFIILIILIFMIFNSGKRKIITEVESTLKDVSEISELNTLKYIYNGIARKYKDSDNKKPMYYVAYEGSVTLGIDFSLVKMHFEGNNLIVEIPEIKINGTVDEGSLDYIFVKDRYETEDVSYDAINLCKEDIEEKAKSELVMNSAIDSTKDVLTGLISPFISSKYNIVFK